MIELSIFLLTFGRLGSCFLYFKESCIDKWEVTGLSACRGSIVRQLLAWNDDVGRDRKSWMCEG